MLVIPNMQITEHFRYNEPSIRCQCCNRLIINDLFYRHMSKLETLRQELGFALLFNSGYRCPPHNKAVGGSENSMHTKFASDIRPEIIQGEDIALFEIKLRSIEEKAEELHFGGIGVYDEFIHLDCRDKKARWKG